MTARPASPSSAWNVRALSTLVLLAPLAVVAALAVARPPGALGVAISSGWVGQPAAIVFFAVVTAAVLGALVFLRGRLRLVDLASTAITVPALILTIVVCGDNDAALCTFVVLSLADLALRAASSATPRRALPPDPGAGPGALTSPGPR